MTQIVHSKHPLLPAANRSIHYSSRVGATLGEILSDYGIRLNDGIHPYFIQINGLVVDAADYDTTIVGEDDFITVRAGLAGGKGSNVLASILEIVLVIVVSYFTAGAGAGLIGLTAGSATAMGVGAAVMIGGSLLIQHLVGAIAPNNQNQAVTPYYSISQTSNTSRPNQPMPIVFGTIRMAPDLDCTPYTDYESGNQYLFQTFNFGISNFGANYVGISDMCIGTTPITAYQNVQTQWGDANGKLTLFPGNVFTDTGPDLTYIEGAVQKTTSDIGCVAIGIDIAGELFHVNSNGSLSTETCVFQIMYRVTGTTEWLPFFQATNPSSIYTYNQGNTTSYGVEPESSQVSLSNATQNPYNITLYQQVPLGQYDVQITRLTQDFVNSTTDYANLTWAAIRSYEPDTADYTGQTRMAVKIEATGQLNGAIQQLNALVSAQCPVWNGSEWVTQATSNPAWWFLWVARGGLADTGTRLFGAGLEDSQIDIAGIIDWAAWCDANSLEFNYIEGSQRTLSDMLTIIARVGRGTPTYSKGVLGAIWDEEGLPVTQMFTMANIRQGSFQMSYISNQLAEQIVVTFLNPDLNYQQDQVACTVPGVTAPEYVVTINIPGITSKTQAAQEAALQAAAQYYFRRSLQFETDIEGLVCQRGDVVAISHDLTNWSFSGRLADVTSGGSATQVILDREVTITEDTQPYFSCRHPDGTYEVVEVVTGPGTTNTLSLETALSVNPYTDEVNTVQDYIYSFDPAATPGRLMKVLSIEPLDNKGNQVRITCREENDAYYAAATDPDFIYITPTLLNQNPATVTNIGVTENTVPGIPGTQVTVSWTLEQAAYAILSIQQGTGGYTNYGNQYQTSFTFSVLTPCVLNIQLIAVSLAQVAQSLNVATYQYVMVGTGQQLPEAGPAEMANVTGLQLVNTTGNVFTGQDAKFQWNLSAANAPEVGSEPFGGDSGSTNPYFLDYQVTILNTDEDQTTRRVDYTQNTNYTYTFEMNAEDGDGTPVRSFTISVVARGMQNQLSPTPAVMTVSNPPPAVPTGITFTSMFNAVNVTFDTPTDLDYAGCLIYGSTSDTFTVGPSTLLLDAVNTNNVFVTGLSAGTEYYFYLQPYDLFGQTGLNTSSEYNCTTALVTGVDLSPGSVDSSALAVGVALANIGPSGLTASYLAADAALANISPGSITGTLIAGLTLTGSLFANNTITSSLLATNAAIGNITTNSLNGNTLVAGSVTAGQLNVTTLSAITANVGTLTAGILSNNSGTNVINLGATGSTAFISTPGLTITAAGTATFSGTLSGAIVSTANLQVLSGGGQTIDTNNGKITWSNGTFMKVIGVGFGSTSQFIEWFGPYFSSLSSCTELNALAYLKTNGSAYFGGTLSAGTLTTKIATSSLSTTASVDTGVYGSNGGTITVVLAFSMTASDTFSGLPGTKPSNTSGSEQVTITLTRSLAGGGFTTAATLTATGTYTETYTGVNGNYGYNYSSSCTGSLTFTDPTLSTQSREYVATMSGSTMVSWGPTGAFGLGSMSQLLSVISTE